MEPESICTHIDAVDVAVKTCVELDVHAVVGGGGLEVGSLTTRFLFDDVI